MKMVTKICESCVLDLRVIANLESWKRYLYFFFLYTCLFLYKLFEISCWEIDGSQTPMYIYVAFLVELSIPLPAFLALAQLSDPNVKNLFINDTEVVVMPWTIN